MTRNQEKVHVCLLPYPTQKINGFARFTKMGREDVVGTCPPIGAATDRHQTDQSRFYLCCGYKGVDVHFVQRIVTSNMTKKIEMTEIFVDS